MQKTEFIKAVAERSAVSQRDTSMVINATIELIGELLAKGEKVTLTGFGTFEVRERQAREGVNPQTREKIHIPATRTPGFSASSTLKEMVKDS
jgi:DNA-binding protein HU-beta